MSRLISAAGCFARRVLFLLCFGCVMSGAIAIGVLGAEIGRHTDAVLDRGAELFAREWLPGDPRSHGGDGLGPVYNETSCIACHHQGGVGGAGPVSTNVDILTAGTAATPVDLHPGFRISRSVLLHRFAVDPEYQAWRLRLLDKGFLIAMLGAVDTEIQLVQGMVATRSVISVIEEKGLGSGLALVQRNPPALFGAGSIDSISDEVLLNQEKQRFPEHPEVHGRANRLKDGRVGKFGWKAGIPTLRGFVLAACANELGLEVPGHHQAASPLDRVPTARGLDLTSEECEALVAYVRHLPPPTASKPAGFEEFPAIAGGRLLFQSIGCATCHRPRIGSVEGIYSDLLVHDMGPALASFADYYSDEDEITSPDSSLKPITGMEWRTPPLWGFRDSGPYLHDGRAESLEQAVAFHGGEGTASAKRFFQLKLEDRLRVRMFLRSLAPPPAAAPLQATGAEIGGAERGGRNGDIPQGAERGHSSFPR